MRKFIFPLLIVIVCTPFMIGTMVFQMDVIQYQLIAIVIIIAIQLWTIKRDWNKCQNCGHDRHMHNKKDMTKRGYNDLVKKICNDFSKARGTPERNYTKEYDQA